MRLYFLTLILIWSFYASIEYNLVRASDSLSNKNHTAQLYEALSEAYQNLKKAEKNSNPLAILQAHVRLANVYKKMRLYKEAIEHTQKALEISRKHNKWEQASLLSQLVLLHLADNNLIGALQYAEEEKELHEKQKMSHSLAISLCVLGDIYIQLKKHHEASVALNQAYSIALKEKDAYLQWQSVLHLAKLHIELQDAEHASLWLEKALSFLKKDNQPEWIEYHLLHSKALQALKKLEEAIEAASFALDKAMLLQAHEYMDECILQLATLYETAGQHESALRYYKIYTQIIQSVQHRNLYENIEQLEIKFEVETKDQKIEMLTKEADFARYQTIIGGIAFLIVSILLFISYNAYRDKRDSEARLIQANQNIQAQNQEILRQNTLIANRNKVIAQTVQYAKRIQQYMYAGQPNYFKVFSDYFVKDLPVETISGDFYWTTYRADSFVIVFADCPEHDVAGAFNTVVMSALTAQVVQEYNYRNPAEILEEIDTRMKQLQNPQEKFSLSIGVKMAICTINIHNKRMIFASANMPLYYMHSQEVHYIKPDKRTVGRRYRKQKPKFQNHIFTLSSKDRLWFLSDGYINQIGYHQPWRLSKKVLLQILQESTSQSLVSQGETLVNFFNNWKGSYKQIDDVLIFGLEI